MDIFFVRMSKYNTSLLEIIFKYSAYIVNPMCERTAAQPYQLHASCFRSII